MTPAQPAPTTRLAASRLAASRLAATRLAATRLAASRLAASRLAAARLADGTRLTATTRIADGTSPTATTRIADGTELPAAGRWQIDPGHTELAFIGRHFMLTKVRGRFTGLSGVIQIAEEPGDSTVELTIDMASVESGSQARDEHLRSADLFDVAQHPRATFSGHAADWHGTRGLLSGVLTMRDIARPVTLQAEYLGYAADPWGGHRAVFTAAGTIDREDWGLTWNLPLDGDGLLVSKEIRIEIELEAVLDPEA